MRRKRLDDETHVPTMLHFNVKYRSGIVCPYVTARYFEGEKPAAIEWVWIRELKRPASTAEIAALCKKEGSQIR